MSDIFKNKKNYDRVCSQDISVQKINGFLPHWEKI